VSLASGVNQFITPGGDPILGLLQIAQGYATFKVQVASSCFTARMLLRAEEGKRRVDSIREGDLVWSRDEHDPYGPLVLKRVQEVFVRVAPIWAVKIPGQTIETTAEHPFYVFGRGWIPTRMIEVGDLFITDEGLLVTVEGMEDTGRVETVYNFLVEDFHTYFVSETEEGVSVWAHNTGTTGCGPTAAKAPATTRKVPKGGIYVLRDPTTGKIERSGRTNDLARRESEHARDPKHSHLEFEVMYRTDSEHAQRGLEQLVHETFKPPLNKIGGIDPANTQLPKYRAAARNFLESDRW
jgi:hypothetical protein